MRDVEYEMLLDAVCAAVTLVPEEDFLVQASPRPQPAPPPRAANDNGRSWPLIPFPEGWYAAC